MDPSFPHTSPILPLVRIVALVVALAAAPPPSLASGGPESVAVVVNSDSWASSRIANEYIRLRGIPPANVIYLSGLASFDSVTAEVFRQKILLPVLTTIEKRGLQSQIDCIAYSADLPSSIDGTEDAKNVTLSPYQAPIVSSSGATYLYKLFLNRDIRYVDFGCNLYASRVISKFQDGPWTAAERAANEAALDKLGRIMAERKNRKADVDENAARQTLTESISAFQELRVNHPNSGTLLYHIACCQACLGETDQAIVTLGEALEKGWNDATEVLNNSCLDPLRDKPQFQELMGKMADATVEITPTRGFSSKVGWTADGGMGNFAQGVPYMLSTALACTSGRGNSVTEALHSLRRSVQADGSRPKGTVYFERNGDVRSTTREWGFKSAAERLKAIGVEAVIEDGVLPRNKNDVIGALVGAASFSWSASGSVILPGAICEHCTSFGGMLREKAAQTPLTEWIRFGAAGASGAVAEPYSLQAKFPTAFIHVHYAEGCSLAEAFFQSVSGPYQLLVVGDPLCRPWPRRIAFSLTETPPQGTVSGPLVIKPELDPSSRYRPMVYEHFIDGVLAGFTAPGNAWSFDTTKLAAGPHELVVVAVSEDLLAHGRVALPFSVGNHEGTLTATAVAKDVAWDKPLEIEARLKGACEILFFHNNRQVGRIDGAEGRVLIDPKTLGEGPSRIIPAAVVGVGNSPVKILGTAIDVNIHPPAPLPALEDIGFDSLANGFVVAVPGKTEVVVERIEEGWLAKAGVDAGDEFEVRAFFDVPEDGVYQFQMSGTVSIRSLAIDGVIHSWPGEGPWWFIPAHLKKGVHRLGVKATMAQAATLDLCFGGSGTRRLDGKSFKHR